MSKTTTAGAAHVREEPPTTPGRSGAPPNVSGVRAAVRPAADATDGALVSTLANVATGKLADGTTAVEREALEGFAAALPELFEPGIARRMWLGSLEDDGTHRLEDLVLVSPRRVHVAQRIPGERMQVVVSVARRGGSIGWILSEARAALTRR
jgi:hypothetical protein